MFDVAMSVFSLLYTVIVRSLVGVSHISTILRIMRFFSSTVLSLSILVVFVVRTYDARGDGHYNPTIRDYRPATTLVADGPFFRPKSQVAAVTAAASTSPLFNDVGNHESILIRSPQRGGATKAAAGTTITTNGLPKALAGAITFAMIEKMVKATLKQLNIAYPAQLGACIVLFVVLCLTDALVSPSVASNIYTFLTPGAALLAKWFPIFFIPGLVLLPLSPPIGGTADVGTIRNRHPT